MMAVALALISTGPAYTETVLKPALATPDVSIPAPRVTSPPESFFEMLRDRVSNPGRFRGRRASENSDRPELKPKAEAIESEMLLYRNFYKKYIDVQGMPVAAHADVADLALQRTYQIVTHLLAGRPDILQSMVSNHTYLIIIGKNQVYTDMPEYRNHPNPAFQNERVRGTGGNPTSFGEENLLSLPIDRYDDESIGVHEFCHTIDSTLRRIDPTWEKRRSAAFENVREKGLYFHTYAGSNPAEYWAEIAQSYFDCNRVNNWNHGPVGRREQLKVYDPMGYELCRSVFNLTREQDWRYQWLQTLPRVTAPPDTEMFRNINPWYTKFTWAREFTVVGRAAREEALLGANETIRRMFAYRHDILKALIAAGVKLVVLGPEESIADLPEYRQLTDRQRIDHTGRFLTYDSELKLLAVGQENVLADRRHRQGSDQVIQVLADAVYKVAGMRPVIPDYNGNQQYELRVQRLDTQLDKRISELFDKAMAAKKWQGTSSVADKFAYWNTGVLAYFNATGQNPPPRDCPHSVTTREALQNYDPDLFALVNETMAYEGHVDWRADL